ncbi:DNA primase [bacterium]|nr:DNA primase [bacterium]
MKIPEEKIQEVREATDLVEVISQHVTLKKRGKSFLGLCPFHEEKTPSFNVDPVRNFYHCFGCNAGGNVFTFLMHVEKVSFPEAVRQLARKAGIALPETDEDDGRFKETELLYKVNDMAAQFFRRCLKETEAGARALDYFHGRDLTDEMVEEFGIGYAPKTWEGILLAAKKQSIPESALLKAGLVVESQRGKGIYDRFRGRLMFPIHHASGRVIGFGGRLLKDEPRQPKYLNSPETLIYQKSKLVYGLAQAKSAIREKGNVLLVEGYTDVLRLYQAGLKNVVASAGTALTAQQATLLRRYAKRIYLIYDGDNAGLDAAGRGAEILLANGLEVFIIALPQGSDPDTFVKDSGVDALKKLIEDGKTFVDFRLERLEAAGRLKTPSDRAEAARHLLETLRQIPDAIERDLSMKAISNKLDVDLKLLMNAAATQVRRLDKRSISVPERQDNARQGAEKMLLRLLLENSAMWADAIFHLVEPVHFEEGTHRIVAETIYQGYLSGDIPGLQSILDQFQDQPEIGQYLSTVMTEGLAQDIDLSRLGLDCVIHLRLLVIKDEIELTRSRLRTAFGEEGLAFHKRYAALKKQSSEMPEEIEILWKKFVEI